MIRPLNPNAFVPGNEYSFSANVMFNDGSLRDTFLMKLQYTDANGDVNYSTIAEVRAKKGEWAQLANMNYKIPDDAEDIYLYIETENSVNSFYVDEVIGAVGGTGILGAGVPKDVVLGDINNDEVVDVYDLIMARKAYLKKDSESFLEEADVDRDGTFGINDILLLADFILGSLSEFPNNG